MRGTPVVLGTLDSGSTQEGSLLDAIALWTGSVGGAQYEGYWWVGLEHACSSSDCS